MVSIVTKKIKGNEYLYLVQSVRKGERVSQKTLKYIGPKRPIPREEFECMELSAAKKDWILRSFDDTVPYTTHKELHDASRMYQEFILSLDETSKEGESEKFLSKFIASSNAIEGSTLSAKETSDFLFHDIVPPHHSKKELFMASNLLDAWIYLEKNSHLFPNENDLFELHRRVNRGIESDRTLGRYKTVQNYIGDVHTSSYLFVLERMKQLMLWIKKSFAMIDDFEVAFQSHGQFEVIHPFVDGNGRVGRLLMNWLLLYKKLSPLVIDAKSRANYIVSLDNFRLGNISAISLFCSQQYLKQYEFVK